MLSNSQFKYFNNPLDLAIKSLLIISPLFFISTRGWVNGVLFATSLLSMAYLVKTKSFIPSTLTRIQKNRVFLVLLTLSIGFIAILISQLLQHNIRMKPYDAPLRMVLCIPIFLYLLHQPFPTSKLLSYALSLSTLITLLTILLHPEIPQFWGGRFATKPADPNAFGAYITLITTLIFFSIDPKELFNRKLESSIKLVGFLIGVYLVAGSETRGAWLSIPFVLLAWFLYHARKDIKGTLVISIIMILACLISYQLLGNLQARVNSGFTEVFSWLYTQNKDTSAGIRFSMWEITADLFLERPFSGFGDLSYQSYLSNPIFTEKYSPIVIETMAKAGPHNEYLANLLRSGIWGGISVLVILVTPLFILTSKIAKNDSFQYLMLQGMALFICLAITGLSIEIFNLKYTSSFYGLIVVMLCSEKIMSLKNIESTHEQK
jgi:O-antigen ligase